MTISSTNAASIRSYANVSSSQAAGGSVSGSSSSASYIDQLKNKFQNLNLSAGDYNGGQSGSGVQGNVLISPKYLEKAANDPAVAAKLEANLGGVPDAEAWLKNQCAAQGMTLEASGTVVDEDGNWSGWSVTTTANPSSKDGKTDDADDDKKLEEKRAEKRRQQKKDEEADRLASQFTNYDGLYETPRTASTLPYSLNIYA
jgi:hypothetical protein